MVKCHQPIKRLNSHGRVRRPRIWWVGPVNDHKIYIMLKKQNFKGAHLHTFLFLWTSFGGLCLHLQHLLMIENLLETRADAKDEESPSKPVQRNDNLCKRVPLRFCYLYKACGVQAGRGKKTFHSMLADNAKKKGSYAPWVTQWNQV